MDHIDAGGHRIAYEQQGDGPPVVFVHGYVGDRRTWRPQIDDLSDEFTAVAWDAPGFGGSSDPPDAFDLADFADCLAAFIDGLGLGRPHVAGLSFGGALALALQRRHAAIPHTLVLASAYAGWGGSLPGEVTAERLQQALELADLSADQFVNALLPTMFSRSTPSDVVDEFGATMLEFHPAGFRAMARALAEDLRDVPAHVSVPTLLVTLGGGRATMAGVKVSTRGDYAARALLSMALHGYDRPTSVKEIAVPILTVLTPRCSSSSMRIA